MENQSSYNAKKVGEQQKVVDIFGIQQVRVKHLRDFKAARLATELDYIDKVLFCG